MTGGRRLFGKVTLRLKQANCFEFQSKVDWPRKTALFETNVIDGILDAAFLDLHASPENVMFVLEEIEWSESDSVAHAYRNAARDAVKEAFRYRLVQSDV